MIQWSPILDHTLYTAMQIAFTLPTLEICTFSISMLRTSNRDVTRTLSNAFHACNCQYSTTGKLPGMIMCPYRLVLLCTSTTQCKCPILQSISHGKTTHSHAAPTVFQLSSVNMKTSICHVCNTPHHKQRCKPHIAKLTHNQSCQLALKFASRTAVISH